MPLGFGIDLGTTNCSIAVYRDDSVTAIGIKQPVAGSMSQELFTLPSYLYIPPSGGEPVSGIFAREIQNEQLGRVVSSAKSWLAEHSTDAYKRFLPWGSDVVTNQEMVSPVDTSAHYLRTLKAAIESRFGVGALLESSIVITVPASFDERACQLTLAAAKAAGFPDHTLLLEEPQAAFYRYLTDNKIPEDISTLLVCDIGGGTTDLSLFSIDWIPGRATPELERIQIGDHLLLGGDNLDLGLATLIKNEIEAKGKSLSRTQWQKLLAQSQKLKEQCLAPQAQGEITISLPDSGRSLFKSTLTHKIELTNLRDYLLETFFPVGESVPQKQLGAAHTGGALNYAKDHRFTSQVAQFLHSSLLASGRKVDGILFVGGSLIPEKFRERIVAQITLIQGDSPRELEQKELELAVSLGAAEYLLRRDKKLERIRSGQARSLYLELAGKQSEMLCLVPLGFESEDSLVVAPRSGNLAVKLNSPVQFNLYGSTHRNKDRAGDTFLQSEIESDVQLIAPVKTMLNLSGSSSKVSELPVEVSTKVNELGRLELSLVNNERELKWSLKFELNSEKPNTAPKIEIAGLVSKEIIKPAISLINEVYGSGTSLENQEKSKKLAKGIFKAIELALKKDRKDWDPLLLRGLWSALERGMTKKNRTKEHELSWFALAGFLLRPGIGVELDNERVERLWKVFNLGISFSTEKAHQVQWWTMWRRVALGLNGEKQSQLFRLAAPKGTSISEIKLIANEPEKLRLLCSLEAIEKETREHIFKSLWSFYRMEPSELVAWGLSRLISRNLISGKVDTLISVNIAEEFIAGALEIDLREEQYRSLSKVLIAAAQLTSDPLNQVSAEFRELVIKQLSRAKFPESEIESLKKFAPMGEQMIQVALGEELPPGLLLRSNLEGRL